MASIVNDPNGRRRLLFHDLAGVRRTVRLGKLTARQADAIKTKVETVVGDQVAGRLHDDEVSRWLRDLPPALAVRLERAGLATGGGTAHTTFRTLREKFFATANVKAGTATTYRQASASLTAYFGDDRPIRGVTNLDADEWRQSM